VTNSLGYGFGRVKTLGRFNVVIDDNSVCVMLVKFVPDDVQKIALLVEHPFTKQPHIMITSTVGKLKDEEIIPSDAVNLVPKTPIWANDIVVIPKKHVGHINIQTFTMKIYVSKAVIGRRNKWFQDAWSQRMTKVVPRYQS
jgi:hypothetical protein